MTDSSSNAEEKSTNLFASYTESSSEFEDGKVRPSATDHIPDNEEPGPSNRIATTREEVLAPEPNQYLFTIAGLLPPNLNQAHCSSTFSESPDGVSMSIVQPTQPDITSHSEANSQENMVSSNTTAQNHHTSLRTTEPSEPTTIHRNLPAVNSELDIRARVASIESTQQQFNRTFVDDPRSQRCLVSNELIDFSRPSRYTACVSCGRCVLAHFAHLHQHCNACVTCHALLETAPFSHTEVCTRCGRQICWVCSRLPHFCNRS